MIVNMTEQCKALCTLLNMHVLDKADLERMGMLRGVLEYLEREERKHQVAVSKAMANLDQVTYSLKRLGIYPSE